MADKKVLVHFGFEVCDEAGPWYELVVKKFDSQAENPRFWDTARQGRLTAPPGLDFFYSPCCPFNHDFTHIMADVARNLNFPIRITELKSREDLQLLPIPWGIFSVFLDGELLSAEVMTESKFRKLLEKQRE